MIPSNLSPFPAAFASASSLTLSSGFLFAATLSWTFSINCLNCCIRLSRFSNLCVGSLRFLSRCTRCLRFFNLCVDSLRFSSRSIRFSKYLRYWLAVNCVLCCDFSHLFPQAFRLISRLFRFLMFRVFACTCPSSSGDSKNLTGGCPVAAQWTDKDTSWRLVFKHG